MKYMKLKNSTAIHAVKKGTSKCGREITERYVSADVSEATCKSCIRVIDGGGTSKKKASKKKSKPKKRKLARKTQINQLKTERTKLAFKLMNASRKQRRKPKFIKLRERLIEVREGLKELGYMSKVEAGFAEYAAFASKPKRRRRKR